jgi:lipopolysaccharide export system protein LptA
MSRFLVLLLALFSVNTLAEKADREKPTQVEANRMSADDVRRVNVFEGNVVVTRGTIRVLADKVIVRQDAQGNQVSTATGEPVRFRQRQDPKPPATEGEWMEGEAKRIVIDDAKGTIELFESARVNRGGDEVAGDYIFVDQRSDFFQVSSGKKGDADGRVRAILQPKPPAGEGK